MAIPQLCFACLMFQMSSSDQAIVDSIIQACDRHMLAHHNLRLQVEQRFGPPPTYVVQDEYEVLVLGKWILADLKHRLRYGREARPGEAGFRVGAFTDSYFYKLYRDDPDGEYRVEGVELDPALTLAIGERYVWGGWIAGAAYSVGNIPLSQMLKTAKDIHVSTSDLDGVPVWRLQFEPTDPEFVVKPVPECIVYVDVKSLAIAGWEYVYTVTVDGVEHYSLVRRRHILKTWPEAGNITFPVHLIEEGVQVTAPHVDAPHKSPPIPREADVRSVEIGTVTEESFLPSNYGIPNSIVFHPESKSRIPVILACIIGANVMIAALWYTMSRRRRRNMQ